MAEEKYAAEKQSFESNAEIQHWIRTQAAEGEDAFSSEFLTSHHERDWIMSSLAVFHGRGLITNVRGQVQPGKEANVYRCTTETARPISRRSKRTSRSSTSARADAHRSSTASAARASSGS